MNQLPEIGEHVRFDGRGSIGSCTGTVLQIYPCQDLQQPRRWVDTAFTPERWRVSVKVDATNALAVQSPSAEARHNPVWSETDKGVPLPIGRRPLLIPAEIRAAFCGPPVRAFPGDLSYERNHWN